MGRSSGTSSLRFRRKGNKDRGCEVCLGRLGRQMLPHLCDFFSKVGDKTRSNETFALDKFQQTIFRSELLRMISDCVVYQRARQ